MKKLLIVVDFQNDFVKGSLGFSGAELIEDPILNKIKEYEKKGDHIIYTFDTHYDNYLETMEGKGLPIKHCIKETDGHALFGKVWEHYKNTNYEHSFTVFKDSFGSVDLMKELVNRETYNEIELVGLVSYICVLSNAVIARSAQPEALIIVDSNCTAGPNKELHESCLNLMQEALQVKIIS
ncbi:MAG: cysteine hydrolase family protein [Defluviitaleaceae bacterium]|nr:cysteine hydrolase family protein [Defluviitaleaceae bacterium]